MRPDRPWTVEPRQARLSSMRRNLTDQEIADYRRDGFLAVEDFLTPAELAHWREVVDAAVADGRAQTGTRRVEVFTQRMQLRRTSRGVQQLVEDPQLGRLAAELEGVDAVRIYLDQALVKEPYGMPTQYHLDLPWWPFDTPHACTIWVALDDSTLENGCLYFVPRSHRLQLTAAGDLGPDLGAVFVAHPEAAYAPRPCPLPAGGCSIHNARTVHGAGANMTPGRRRAMTAAFMPDGVRFNGKRDPRGLGERYAATLTEGDRLDNDELNPVVYTAAQSRSA
jgi:phytanoyl-CoA hydroxylase